MRGAFARGWPRGLIVEIGLLSLFGLFMGVLGPFDTSRLATGLRITYWMLCIVGGGSIGILFDGVVARWRSAATPRTLITVLAMTPPTTVLVVTINHIFLGDAMDAHLVQLSLQVLVISLALMTVRALTRRSPETIVETRTIVAAPLECAARNGSKPRAGFDACSAALAQDAAGHVSTTCRTVCPEDRRYGM